MNRFMLLLCTLSLAFFACEEEQAVDPSNNSVELTKVIEFNNLTNSTIGFEKDGKVKLQVSDERIMSIFRKFVSMYQVELKPRSFEVLKIGENNYLRFYSDNDQVSTIALLKDENNEFQTGSTICVSKASDTGDGCLPDGLYCTKSKVSESKDDCKRITALEN